MRITTMLLSIILIIVTVSTMIIPLAYAHASVIKDSKGDWFESEEPYNPTTGAGFSDIVIARIIKLDENWLTPAVLVDGLIPFDYPPDHMAYWFALDTDRNSATGLTDRFLNDIGAELLIGAYHTAEWHIVVLDLISGIEIYTVPDTDYRFTRRSFTLRIPLLVIELPSSFDWVAYTWDWSTGSLVWENVPNEGHATFP